MAAGGWQELEVPLSDEIRELADIRMWVKEFNTSEDPEGWRAFIYDPLVVLREEGVVPGDDDWRLTTQIVNHHRPLNPRIGLVSVTTNDRERDAGVTIYKVEEGT